MATAQDVVTWLGLGDNSGTVSDTDLGVIDDILNAVGSHLAVFYPYATGSADGQQAQIMMAARLYKRRDTAGGTQMMVGMDNISVRVAGYDPDIQMLLAPYKTVVFA